jgi:serine/threonine-protein kinase
MTAEREPPSRPAVPAQIGDIIAEKYRVERVIGEGGMAVVFAAHHLQLDRIVALKILKPTYLSSPDVVARFLREARSAARLTSEHVATVLDVGTLEQGLPYLVMEHLRGSDLGCVLGERGKLPLATAVDLILQVADAIAEAHAQGMVHRDLKPENLFLTRRADGTDLMKVLDFGIAKAAAQSQIQAGPGVTQPSATFGSPAYMCPEQIRSARDVDARADIWALGVILYELVSGEQPFAAATAAETCAMVLRDEPRSLGALCPDVPKEFVAAVHKCLEKEPERRCPTVVALAGAIAPFGGASAVDSAERIRFVLEGGSPTLRPPSLVVTSTARASANDVTLDNIDRDGAPRSGASLVTSTTVPESLHPIGKSQRWVLALALSAAALAMVIVVAVYGASRRSDASSAPSLLANGSTPSPDAAPISAAVPSASADDLSLRASGSVANAAAASASAQLPVTLASADRVPSARVVAPGVLPSPPPRKRTDLYGTRR